MKRTHPKEILIATKQLLNAIFHLTSSFVCKRHCQNTIRFYIVLRNQVSNFIRNRAGLSRTGSGKDQHRAINLFCGSGLLRVQFTIKYSTINNVRHQTLL